MGLGLGLLDLGSGCGGGGVSGGGAVAGGGLFVAVVGLVLFSVVSPFVSGAGAGAAGEAGGVAGGVGEGAAAEGGVGVAVVHGVFGVVLFRGGGLGWVELGWCSGCVCGRWLGWGLPGWFDLERMGDLGVMRMACCCYLGVFPGPKMSQSGRERRSGNCTFGVV